MTEKISVFPTDEYTRLLQDSVKIDDYDSPSEVLRKTLPEWKTSRLMGQMWVEGSAIALSDPSASTDGVGALWS